MEEEEEVLELSAADEACCRGSAKKRRDVHMNTRPLYFMSSTVCLPMSYAFIKSLEVLDFNLTHICITCFVR